MTIMPLVLHGYRYSVYLRIVRLALAEKGVGYDRVEVNPFAPDVPAVLSGPASVRPGAGPGP